ncbi:unnamed protein product [Cylicostephanus goldi]|uniref:Uncharacterized protein n=1 Tax=Cylicostephanus goldi TaxID=71465 RepID=A0A3P7M9J9_CYLGO|nr:unnamed protein product [Cylicostephanus goldi]
MKLNGFTAMESRELCLRPNVGEKHQVIPHGERSIPSIRPDPPPQSAQSIDFFPDVAVFFYTACAYCKDGDLQLSPSVGRPFEETKIEI